MYSWKFFCSVLFIGVFLVESQYYALAVSSSASQGSLKISPSYLRSSNIYSSPENLQEVMRGAPYGFDKRPDNVIRSLENGLLKMFGLNSRPKPKKNIHIPAYMLELYEQAVLANKEVYSRYDNDDSENDFMSGRPRSNSMFPFVGATVRGFYHQDEHNSLISPTSETNGNGKRSLKKQKDEHSAVFNFNISNFATDETLLGAELRLFRQNSSSSMYKSQSRTATNTHSSKPHKYKIAIYEIIRPASQVDGAVSRLIDTRVVDSSRTQWESFDVHLAVQRWRQKPHENHGLHVTVTSLETHQPSGGNHVRLRRAANGESSSTTSWSNSESEWAEQRPFLVTYSADAAQKRASRRQRTKRGARSKRKRSRAAQRKRKRGECKRQPLYVDFSDVGWDDWIVAPPGYRAYFCSGECGFPLPEYINATNHAIVQTLVHSVNPGAVPRPCCVPTELSPISMLYVDEHDKVTLKNYQDMVVEGCGCR